MFRRRYVLVPVFLLFLSGCAELVLFGVGTAVGVGGFKYYEGSLTVSFEAPFMDTWDATLAALKEMNLKVESAEHGISSGKIMASYPADEKPVTVRLDYRSAKETRAVIRVGIFGNESVSLVIKDKIATHLAKG